MHCWPFRCRLPPVIADKPIFHHVYLTNIHAATNILNCRMYIPGRQTLSSFNLS